tara:strand:+ start:196 stop:360 length:165 start_codon:yes stop_codon:yes gene_type:complete
VRDQILARVSDADIQLIKGKTGDFEVTVDGTLKFSKQELGRFPSDDETVALAGA